MKGEQHKLPRDAPGVEEGESFNCVPCRNEFRGMSLVLSCDVSRSSGQIGSFPHTIVTTTFLRLRETYVHYARIHFGTGAQQPPPGRTVRSPHHSVILSLALH